MNESARHRQPAQRDKADGANVDLSSEKNDAQHESVEKSENQVLIEQESRTTTEPKKESLTPVYGDEESKKSAIQTDEKAKSQDRPQKLRTKSPDPISNLLFRKPSLEPQTDEKPVAKVDSREQNGPESKPKKISDSQAKKIAAQKAREHKQRSLVKALYDRDASYLDGVNRSLEPQRDASKKAIDRGAQDSPERDELAELIKPPVEVPAPDLEKSSRLPDKPISLDKASAEKEQPALTIESTITRTDDQVVYSRTEPVRDSRRDASEEVEAKIPVARDLDQKLLIEKESAVEKVETAQGTGNRVLEAASDLPLDVKPINSVERESVENIHQKQTQAESIRDRKNELEHLQPKQKSPSHTDTVSPQKLAPAEESASTLSAETQNRLLDRSAIETETVPTAPLTKNTNDHSALHPERQALAPERLLKPEKIKEKPDRTPFIQIPGNVPRERHGIGIDRNALGKEPSEQTKSWIEQHLHKDAHAVIEPVLKEHPRLKQLLDRSMPNKDSEVVKALRDWKLERQVDEFMHKYQDDISKPEHSRAQTEETERTNSKSSPDLVIELPPVVVRQVMTMNELEPETIAFLKEQFSPLNLDRDSNTEPKVFAEDRESTIVGKPAISNTRARELRAREQIRQLLDVSENQLTAHEQEREVLVYKKPDHQGRNTLSIEQSMRTFEKDAVQQIIGVENLASVLRGTSAHGPAKQQGLKDTIDRTVVKQSHEIERLRDEEPAPELFCTLRSAGDCSVGIRFWRAKTLEEFDCNDPDIPATADAIQAIVDIDRRWKLWRSRLDRERAELDTHKHLSKSERNIEHDDDFER